jgi:hypothetical protein
MAAARRRRQRACSAEVSVLLSAYVQTQDHASNSGEISTVTEKEVCLLVIGSEA